MRAMLPRDWKEFAVWCESRGLKSLPAHPWTVAAYVRWCEPRKRLPDIVEGLKAITRMHLLKCHKTPDSNATVMKILHQIEIRAQNKEARAALFRAEDFAQALQGDMPDQDDTSKMASKPSSEAPSESSGATQQKDQKMKRMMRSSPRLVRRLAPRGTT